MSPRLIQDGRCPHCRAELPEDPSAGAETPEARSWSNKHPRLCPECGGSLQQRYLRAGCLTSKPLLLLIAATTWTLFGRGEAPMGSAPGAPAARCIDAPRSIHRGAPLAGGVAPSSRTRAHHLAELPDDLRATDALRRPSSRRGEPETAPQEDRAAGGGLGPRR